VNNQISQITNKAIDGGEITALELRSLLNVDSLSEEAYLIQCAARKVSAAAANGKAEVYAQVGMDVGPCPKDCQFCSFAPVNKVFPKEKVYSLEEIIEKSLRFEVDGANAIYLMATANYKFADYLEVTKEVRAALKPKTPMVANIDDFDEDEARALKKAGFAGVYHVMRMGEGIVTGIDPQVRVRTITAAQKAGLLVGACVEPIGPEHSIDEIVEKAMFIKKMKLVHAGVGRRLKIPGSPLAIHGILTGVQQAHIVGAVKLAMGYSIAGHGAGCGCEELTTLAGGNLLWAESGSNPRDTKANTVIGGTVASKREILHETGWKIVDGPSVLFSPR
jgi:biotin synthase